MKTREELIELLKNIIIIIKQVLHYKYELISFLGGVVSINTDSPIALIVLGGGISGMIANTVSPTVQIIVADHKQLNKAFKVSYKEKTNE